MNIHKTCKSVGIKFQFYELGVRTGRPLEEQAERPYEGSCLVMVYFHLGLCADYTNELTNHFTIALDPIQYILYFNKTIYANVSEPDVLVPPLIQAAWRWKLEDTEFEMGLT